MEKKVSVERFKQLSRELGNLGEQVRNRKKKMAALEKEIRELEEAMAPLKEEIEPELARRRAEKQSDRFFDKLFSEPDKKS